MVATQKVIKVQSSITNRIKNFMTSMVKLLLIKKHRKGTNKNDHK